jgi:acetyl-CoA carboxylase carboxyl transferase subunit alpha
MRSLSEYRLPFEAPIYDLEARLAEMEALYADAKDRSDVASADAAEQLRRMRKELVNLKRTVFSNLDPWQTVQVSRHPNRPHSRDYLELVFGGFVELHGDRAVGDDQAIVTGFAHLGDEKVMFIGHQKGKNLAERTACNFGCAHPEGYRKALIKMKMAAKFKLPIVTFIDTPIVTVVIGEGGSGGALGIGMGDRVGMLEHSYYSVISPEGCATILWKGAEAAPKAAAALKMTAPYLVQFGIVDEIVPEPIGGAHRDHRGAAASLKSFLIRSLREIAETPRSELLSRRYDKYRKIGVHLEGQVDEAI